MAKKKTAKKRTESKKMTEFERFVRENRERNQKLVDSFVDKIGHIVEKNPDKKRQQAMDAGLAMTTLHKLATRQTKNPSARTLISAARLNGKKITIT